MKNEKQPQLFISYAWADIDFANEVYNSFKSTGVIIRRDTRDALKSGSVSDLMAKVEDRDVVLLLISDEFIRCTNCMCCITELLTSPKLSGRVLPVLLSNTLITPGKEQEKYYYHWQEQVEVTKRIFKIYGSAPAQIDMDRVQATYDNLGIFFRQLESMGVLTFNELKLRSYAPLIAKMDLPQKHVLGELLEISKIRDRKGHDNELVYVWAKHPDNQNLLYYSAYSAHERQEYDIAKQRFEALLALFPASAAGHCYYAHLLKTYLSEYEAARQHYETALELCPQYADAHHCYAIFLAKQLGMYEEAKRHYETAISLDPQNAELYNNYALLLANHLGRHDDARAYFEMAIETGPQYANAHNNLACLLEIHYKDYTQAKIHYEEAIRLSSRHELARTNLAILIKNHFS